MPNQYTVNKDKDTKELTIEDHEPQETKKYTVVKKETTLQEEGGGEGEGGGGEGGDEQPSSSTPPTTTAKGSSSKDVTLIPLSPTRDEYIKAGLTPPYLQADEERETFERKTRGTWTRQVISITLFRTKEEKIFLDWSEIRKGKSDMGRETEQLVQHVTKYTIPTAIQIVEFDPETEENKLVTKDQEAKSETAWKVPFTKSALNKLIKDAAPYGCEYIIDQHGGRQYSVTRKELEEQADDFENLYNLKADPNFKLYNKK